MKRALLYTICALSLALTGCAPNVMVKQKYQPAAGDKFQYTIVVNNPVSVPENAMLILRNRLNGELSRRNLLAAADNKTAKKIEITVTNYHMRHGAARHLAGIFAGTDVVATTSTVKPADGSSTLAQFSVESTNNSAWGTSQGLIEDHADKIVSELTGGK